MIVTYNWLKEFVDIDAPPQDLCHRLTMAGLEVDSLKELGAGLESVIVARLDRVDPHPDADRLTLCQVNTGSEVVPVVCGATNHKAGDLVALAQPGTVLPGEFKIKKSKIRGQVSFGMLCSEKELGLADTSEGIMILPAQLPVGQPVFDVMGWRDYQIEIGLTPNRPDCLSIIGVAREVAALYGKELKLPTINLTEADDAIESHARVDIKNPQACPRYAARMIRGVKIGPSPDWMVRRLEAVGMRSINNIVDVTNYVMMELGHPLHAFDFRFVDEGRIVVKCAQEGDKFATLDGQEHLLSADDLMICDGRKAVALAGVMGGLNSEVQDDTNTILLEAAYFNPVTVRRTSKRHGLHTESSHRFERGADIDMVPVALGRAAALMAELGGGHVLAGVVDVYPQPLPQRKVKLALASVHRTLDLPLDPVTVTHCLESIGLSVAAQAVGEDHQFDVSIPSFRPDLEREIDLIEEIARLYGYDKIPMTMPVGAVDAGVPAVHQRLQKKLRDMLVAAGFSETINYSFISANAIDKIGLPEDDVRRRLVPILNPLSEEQAVMRTSLVPSLLETVTRNLNYRSTDLRLFELRPVFLSGEGGETKERLSLAAVMTGRREPEGWAQSGAMVDFYDLKGAVEDILTAFGLERIRFAATSVPAYLHPGKSCALTTESGILLGYLGEVHPRTVAAFDIEQPVYLLDLDAEELLRHYVSRRSFTPLSRYPDVSRDTALLVDEDVRAEQVLDILRQHQARTVEDLTLFDLYVGKGIPQGKKSIGVRIRYRDMTKTLTEEEVGKAHDRMIRTLCEKLAAEIR